MTITIFLCLVQSTGVHVACNFIALHCLLEYIITT